MRIAFYDRPVHKRARIALVRIADQIFFRSGRLARSIPFKPGRKSCAASAGQSGLFYRLYYVFRRHFAKHFFKRPISAGSDVFVNAFRIDFSAVPERNPRLIFKKRAILRL